MKIKFLSKLSNEQIWDQTLQILNYSDNFLATDRFNLAAFFSNCCNVLSKYISDKFQKSLTKSLNCIIDSSCYLEAVNALEKGNKDSFILAPLAASNHVFVVAIYKNNDENFECIIVNKGYRGYSHSYEKYLFSYNGIRKIVDILGYHKFTDLSTDDIYNSFSLNCSSNESLYYITSADQKECNCFFKEMEAGFKFIYSNAYTKNFTTPKWPISTLGIRRKLLDNIKNDCPHLASSINEIETVYNKNKSFRIYCKVFPDMDFKRKVHTFSLTFSDRPNSTLQDMLKYLDLQTISENISFLVDLCNVNNVSTLPINSIELLNPPSLKLLNANTLLNSAKEVFPYAYNQLGLRYSIYLDSIGLTFAQNNDFEQAINILNRSITMNPNDASAYAQRGHCFSQLKDLEKASSDFARALKLNPNNVAILYLYASFLYENDNFYAALSESDKISQLEPRDMDNITLKSLIKGELNKLWQL